jgi:2-oxoglutarate ferredoxin oxidoreductase subunit beta
MIKSSIERYHPADSFLHADAFPSVWCPGCGIGTAVYAFIEAVKEENISPNKIGVVSGIGCTSKVTECLKLKTYSVTDGNAVDYAAQLKKKNQDLTVAVFLNNADFLLSGAKDFIEAGKRGANLIVIYVNNFICPISENKVFPITPFMRMSIDNEFELPYNIPHLAKSCGSGYIARWTPIHAGWMKYSLIEAISKKGFSVIEVVSPCLIYNASDGRIQDAVDRMNFYNDNSVMKNEEPTENLDLRFCDKIIIGKFVDFEQRGSQIAQ